MHFFFFPEARYSGKARVDRTRANDGSDCNLHIDRSESTVGDGAADSTSEGESGVELEPREGSRGGRSVDLRSSSGGHYYGLCERLCLTQEKRKRGGKK